MNRRSALTRIAALAAAAAVRRGKPWSPRRKSGVCVHVVNASTLAAIRTIGVERVRYTLYWDLWDDRGPNATRFRTELAALRAANLDIVVVVVGPPRGITLAGGAAALGPFLAERAKETPGLTWQPLNEMDGDDSFNGGWFRAKDKGLDSVARGRMYGEFMAPVAASIRAADKTARVIAGGIALDPVPFVRGMLGTTVRLDAVAVHCYGRPVINQFAGKSASVRSLLTGTSMPLWCTEWGFSSAKDPAQTSELARCLDDNDARDRYDRNYVYVLDGAKGDDYSLTTLGGALRPAAKLLENRAD